MYSNNFYDFIEIGTADYDTLIQKADDTHKGISIDPFRNFLDKLPNKKGCTKICSAIYDKEGETDIFYVTDDDIKNHNLPDWIKWSSSIHSPHPFVLQILNEIGLDPDTILKTKTVPITRLKTIIDQYKIDEIKILKIDAEQSDDIILIDYFNCCKDEGYPLPFFIQYEHVALSPRRRNHILGIAVKMGYMVTQEGEENTTLVKQTQKAE